jgi:hypothetical protein
VPVVWAGEDEAIFQSSLLNEMNWTIYGVSQLRSKGLGVGKMVAAFKTRMFGFRIPLSANNFEQVNEYRSGKPYTLYTGAASKSLYGTERSNR